MAKIESCNHAADCAEVCRLAREVKRLEAVKFCKLTVLLLVCFIVIQLLTALLAKATRRPVPAPAPVVQPDTARATWWVNGTLGNYEIDPDCPGRMRAWIHAPGFTPGMTVILSTVNARRRTK